MACGTRVETQRRTVDSQVLCCAAMRPPPSSARPHGPLRKVLYQEDRARGGPASSPSSQEVAPEQACKQSGILMPSSGCQVKVLGRAGIYGFGALI